MNKMIEKITEATEVIIGRHYLVPHVIAKTNISEEYKKDSFIPILLPLHGDAEIGVPTLHYHYDTRFIANKVFNRSKVFSPIIKQSITIFQAYVIAVWSTTGTIEWKRKVCQREHPIFPIVPQVLSALEPIYENAIAVNNTCPHRGVSMVGCPVKDGIITCPAHGLRWDKKTGKLQKQIHSNQKS